MNKNKLETNKQTNKTNKQAILMNWRRKEKKKNEWGEEVKGASSPGVK